MAHMWPMWANLMAVLAIVCFATFSWRRFWEDDDPTSKWWGITGAGFFAGMLWFVSR